VAGLGVPTYLSGMARGLLGAEHPLLLRHHRRHALREADCVVLAGVPADFRLDYGRHIRRRAKVLAGNRCQNDLHRNRRANVPVLCDAGEFLTGLASHLGEPVARDEWLQTLRSRDREREAEIDEAAARRGERVNPLRLCREIDAMLDENSTVVADGGDFIGTAAYTVRPRGPLRWLDPGAFGTLGVGAGFALGASRLRPEGETWALFGDGALGWSLAEFDTFARHGVPVIAVVGNDACWSQIAREQVKVLGDAVATGLAHTAYHRAVEGLGGAGLEIRHDDEIGEALAEARRLAAEGRPVLVNALLEPSDFREGSISM
jgi:acetolactate synthase-1/2/3 large subunit